MDNKNNFGLSSNNQFNNELNNSRELTNDVKIEIENLNFDSSAELKMDTSNMKLEQSVSNETSNNLVPSETESVSLPEEGNSNSGNYMDDSFNDISDNNDDFESNNRE